MKRTKRGKYLMAVLFITIVMTQLSAVAFAGGGTIAGRGTNAAVVRLTNRI